MINSRLISRIDEILSEIRRLFIIGSEGVFQVLFKITGGGGTNNCRSRKQ